MYAVPQGNQVLSLVDNSRKADALLNFAQTYDSSFINHDCSSINNLPAAMATHAGYMKHGQPHSLLTPAAGDCPALRVKMRIVRLDDLISNSPQ